MNEQQTLERMGSQAVAEMTADRAWQDRAGEVMEEIYEAEEVEEIDGCFPPRLRLRYELPPKLPMLDLVGREWSGDPPDYLLLPTPPRGRDH